MIDDGFAESMDFSRMEVISTLLADNLSQYDWLPDSVYSSPTDIIITYKKLVDQTRYLYKGTYEVHSFLKRGSTNERE